MFFEYRGKKENVGGCEIEVAHTNTPGEDVFEPLTLIGRHSPDGFQWGYGGSGPSETALCILTDYCKRTNQDINLAEINYQQFKRDKISKIKGDLFITGKEIQEWLEKVPTV